MLCPADMLLHCPNHQRLAGKGCFKGNLKSKTTSTSQHIYIVPGLHTPLLGRPATEALGLVLQTESISPYSLLFEGLGKLEGNYKIELMEGAKPYVLTMPRRVAIPLLPQVKAELESNEATEVITRVDVPIE